MEKPFIEIDGKDILFYPQEALAPEGFEFPVNKETGISFPFCCKAHTEFYHNTVAWFTKFPNCCEAHREFAKWPVFNKAIYKGAAERLVKQSIYTEYLIQQKINNADWFEDITDYI